MSKKKTKKEVKQLPPVLPQKSIPLPLLPAWESADISKEPWDLRGKGDESFFEDPDGLLELIPAELQELVDSWKRPREFTKPPSAVDEAAAVIKSRPKTPSKKGKKSKGKKAPKASKAPQENVHVVLPCKLGDEPLRTIAQKVEARNRTAAKLLSQFYVISNWAEAVPKGSFLWESIYPKLSEKEGGGTRYNPYGKYIVRLYVNGGWRRVVIDDRMPFNAEGECLFPTSSEITEIWPTLLAKAIFKLQARANAGSLASEKATAEAAEDPCILHWATGWLVEPIRTVKDEFWRRVESSVEVQGRKPPPPPVVVAADAEGAEGAEAAAAAAPEPAAPEPEKEKPKSVLTLVCARPSFKDVALGQVCAVLAAREKGTTREVLIRGVLNKFVFVDLLKSHFEELIEPEPEAAEGADADADANAAANAKPAGDNQSGVASLAKVVDLLRDEDMEMVLARTGIPEHLIAKYEQVVEEAQDLDEPVPLYSWDQFFDEAISMRAPLWVNVNDVARFFDPCAHAFCQRAESCSYRHNHWRWEPIPEVKKDKKSDEEPPVDTSYITIGDLRALSLQLQPQPMLYVDGGEEGALVKITLMTDAVTLAADANASRAVATVLEEFMDPSESESRALSHRVEARTTCSAGTVSGSQLAVPPGKHFYSFSVAAQAGSVVAVQSAEAPVLFDSPDVVIKQAKPELHVFSISGQTAETNTWSVVSWHSFKCTKATMVKVILHVADPMVLRMIGLRFVDHSTGQVTVMPTLTTPFWAAKATPEGYSVAVVLDSKASRRGGIKDLPSSEWALHIVTDEPITGLSTDAKKNPFLNLKETETNGGYRPNKYLRLFRQLVTLVPPSAKDNSPWSTRLLCQVRASDASAHLKLEVIVPSDDADQAKDQVLCVTRGRGQVELLSWDGPPRQTVVLQASLDASRYTPEPELFSQVPFIQFDVDEKSSKSSKKAPKKANKGSGGKGGKGGKSGKGKGKGGKGAKGAKGGKGKADKKAAGKAAEAAAEKKKTAAAKAAVPSPAPEPEVPPPPALEWWLRGVSNGVVTINHDTAKEVAYEAIRKSWDEGNSSRSEQARVSRLRYLGERVNPPKGSSNQDVGTFPWDELPEVSARVLDAGPQQRVIAEEEKVELRGRRTAALKVSSERLSAMDTEREKNKVAKEARVKELRSMLKKPGEGYYVQRKAEAWELRAEVAKQLFKEEKERLAKIEELTKAVTHEKKSHHKSASRKKKK